MGILPVGILIVQWVINETYVSKELVNAIDKEYKTIKNRKGSAITGLSMGGHGALYLAFKHQASRVPLEA